MKIKTLLAQIRSRNIFPSGSTDAEAHNDDNDDNDDENDTENPNEENVRCITSIPKVIDSYRCQKVKCRRENLNQ